MHDMADAHPLQDTPILTSVYEPATDQTPRLLRHLKAGYAHPLMHTISPALEPYAAKIKEVQRGYRYRYGTQPHRGCGMLRAAVRDIIAAFQRACMSHYPV